MSEPTDNTASGAAPLNPGDQVGAYRIERALGSGGMADVFYAVHEGLRRPAAIKVLRASLATDEVHLQRFMQEARAAASLIHPNIVQVYDVGQDGEHRYIAQEYIPGSNLRQFLAESNLPNPNPHHRNQSAGDRSAAPDAPPPADRQLDIRATLSILLQILAALSKSASSGIVHRDIKPENIMLTKDGDVKVADFGLARILLGDDPQLTRAGTTLGTPMYMSPEQIQEGQVDIRSDLYSLGVTLYHMLTGRPPFTGETPLALAMQHVQATVPALTQFRSDLPDSLVQLVSRLLAKSPEDRFPSPTSVLEFLREHRSGDLAAQWPEHTIPLPGVATAAAGGPSQATLMLQSRLRKGRTSLRTRLLTAIGAAALLLVAFGMGAALTFSRPLRLFESTSEAYKGIIRQESAEKQYQAALLSTEGSRIAKWEAVEAHFPKEETRLNRYYAGLAGLQLARAHLEQDDQGHARGELQKIINDGEMEDLVKAFAYLQQASIEDELDNEASMQKAIDSALSIKNHEDFKAGDREQLDAGVRRMSTKIKKAWFGS